MTQAVTVPQEHLALPSDVGVLRRLASFPVVVSFALVVLTILTVRHRFNDLDLWWHLKIGEQIWATHAIPRFDTFSYTTNHHARTPHEWLAEWLLFGVYRLAGFTGLMVWMCVFASAIVLVSYILGCLYSGNAKTAFLPAMAVWFFSTSIFSVRPQLLGFFFLALELLILELARQRSHTVSYALPLLFVIWVNCHASFGLGLLVLLLSYACASVSVRSGLIETLHWPAEARRHLQFATAASVVAVFINPVGISLIAYPFDTLFHQQGVLGNIQEWQPLTIRDGRGAGLFLLLAFLVALLLAQKRSVYTQEICLLAVGVWLALSHQRLVVVFGIVAAPFFARVTADAWDAYDAHRDLPLANAVLITVSLALIYVVFPNRSDLVKQVTSANPVGAVQFIKAHDLKGNMFNSFDYGGYLMWALPDHPVFVDGRADVFDWTGVMSELAEWSNLAIDPNRLLDKYSVAFCIVERNSPAAEILSLLPNWSRVYDDPLSVIYVRASPHP